MNKRVKDAFYATPLGSILTTLQMRTRGLEIQSGSVFRDIITFQDLIDADWEPYDHPDIKAPAVGFQAAIPGFVGVMALKDVMDIFGRYVQFNLLDGHKSEMNPNGSGYVECVLPRGDFDQSDLYATHTTLLLGPNTSYVKCGSNVHSHPGSNEHVSCSPQCEKGYIKKEVEVVWTFFPGEPVVPSKVINNNLHGTAISGRVAKEMGFTIVKIAPWRKA